ncbi:MAG: hypothetical protein M9920_04395 [Verrucomicrobiae bacterium]|nr:hypothetical protein [Verrucomicrobiae bacterium]
MTASNQQRLGKILWAIADQSAKLESLRTHKRGLMQQLFPSPSEAGA